MWVCSTTIYSQHGVQCEQGKRLKKPNNFIEPPVWCHYSRTLLFPLELIPRGADSISIKCQYKNTITWFKAQTFLGGSVSLDCSPVCVLPLIQMTNIYSYKTLQFFFLIMWFYLLDFCKSNSSKNSIVIFPMCFKFILTDPRVLFSLSK